MAKLDANRIMEAVTQQENAGFCLHCGKESECPVEPDAERYHCDHCDKNGVFGAEQIVLMGYV